MNEGVKCERTQTWIQGKQFVRDFHQEIKSSAVVCGTAKAWIIRERCTILRIKWVKWEKFLKQRSSSKITLKTSKDGHRNESFC